MVKNLPVMQETWVQSLGWEDPLEEGMATHSHILAWRIPMDRGAWTTVHRVTKCQTRPSGSCQPVVTTFSSTDQYTTLGYVWFFLKTLNLIEIDSLKLNSRPTALELMPE